MRGDQLTRQWKLVSLLSGKLGRTLNQLKAELGVTKRTIQRDIAVLEAAGFPLISIPCDGAIYWRLLDPSKQPAGLIFTLPELMALYFSRDLLRLLHGSPMQEALTSAIQKIGASLPSASHDLLRRIEQETAASITGWKDYSHSAQTIKAVQRAIRHRFKIRIVYMAVSASKGETRTLDPYKFWYTGGGLYVVAHDHDRKAVRTFAVERIARIVITNQRFTEREDFDFSRFASSAFPVHGGEPQKVKIKFSPQQAPYIMERHWHDSQQVSPQDDGSVILELQVASLWEVKRWLIGWGADAEVLEPLETRVDLIKTAAKILALYRTTPNPSDRSE